MEGAASLSDRREAASLRREALRVLLLADPSEKAEAARALAGRGLPVDPDERIGEAPGIPGRPPRPVLVRPSELSQRSPRTLEGRAALLHALAHIEFNAIDLALDAVWRFAGLPREFYEDWARVAAEEALHFGLLRERLRALGFDYGDFPAHNGLWEMAEKTRGDPLARIALVPRVLEARGLDVSPPIRAKLAAAGDHEAAAVLDVILRDEIGHVAIGNRWYRWLCERRGLDPLTAWLDAARAHDAPLPRGPFNFEARRAAGFADEELAELARAQAGAPRP